MSDTYTSLSLGSESTALMPIIARLNTDLLSWTRSCRPAIALLRRLTSFQDASAMRPSSYNTIFQSWSTRLKLLLRPCYDLSVGVALLSSF